MIGYPGLPVHLQRLNIIWSSCKLLIINSILNKGILKYVLFALLMAALLWRVQKRGQQEADTGWGRESSAGLRDKIRSLSAQVTYSRHARCRMACRHIDESEVREILEKGYINEAKIESSEKGLTVPLEGTTHDQQHVRIVVAPGDKKMVLVTVIDLDTEWACDCP